jgi:hypothetical protein
MVIPGDRQSEEREILTRIRRGERVDHFELFGSTDGPQIMSAVDAKAEVMRFDPLPTCGFRNCRGAKSRRKWRSRIATIFAF